MQANFRAQTAVRPVRQRQMAALDRHRFLHDCQAQPQSTRIALARVIQPGKRPQHFLQPLARNARTVIIDADQNLLPLA